MIDLRRVILFIHVSLLGSCGSSFDVTISFSLPILLLLFNLITVITTITGLTLSTDFLKLGIQVL